MPFFDPELSKAGFSFKAIANLYKVSDGMLFEKAEGLALAAVARLISLDTGDPVDDIVSIIRVVRTQAPELLHSPEGWREIAKLYPGVNALTCHPTVH